MQLLDGALVSQTIKSDLLIKVSETKAMGRRAPHLPAILVGNHPASASYIKNKIKSCADAGFDSTLIHKDENITEGDLIDIINMLNYDDKIDGFIVQLPLPRHIDDTNVLLAIDPKKDVDGFHPMNLGRMMIGLPSYIPATPLGILKMIEHYKIPTEGKKVVVLGRSNIVGTPISVLMSRKAYPGNATVTLCHSKSVNLESITREADILIVALGATRFVKKNMVKDGAVVIDVGMNQIADNTTKTGTRLVGDVDFDTVAPICSYITESADQLRDINTPESLLLSKQIGQTVNAAIDALPEELRTAIVLREIEGLSYEEIASMMDCPIGTVRSRIFRAREAVASKLRPWLDIAPDRRW